MNFGHTQIEMPLKSLIYHLRRESHFRLFTFTLTHLVSTHTYHPALSLPPTPAPPWLGWHSRKQTLYPPIVVDRSYMEPAMKKIYTVKHTHREILVDIHRS